LGVAEADLALVQALPQVIPVRAHACVDERARRFRQVLLGNQAAYLDFAE